MSQHMFTKSSAWPTPLVIATTLAFSIVLLALSVGRRPVSRAPGTVPAPIATKDNGEQVRAPEQKLAEVARKYPEQTGNQWLNFRLDGTKAPASFLDLARSARALSTAGSDAPETERQEREEEEARGDSPGEAVKFRNLQMRDENGVIPLDGLYKARQQMDVMRAAQQKKAKAAGKPNGIEVAAIAPGAWQWLGPGNVGGRIRSIVIDPANANKMWVGSVSGGIWYSIDAGGSWQPVNDFMADLAVSTMVIDPTNSSIMYAGTGEGLWPQVEQGVFIDGVRGNGVFKSTDGGVTWDLLLQTNAADPFVCPGGGGLACPWSYVNRLAISPDGSTILAATVAGIYRSTDGGANWNLMPSFAGKILDIDFDPTTSQKAIAARAGAIAYSTDGGQSWFAAKYSTDGGATFTAVITNRAEVAYAPSNPSIVYASVDDNIGDLYESLDGGQKYILVNTGTKYFASGSGPDQGGYDNIVWVNPQDATFVVVGGIDLWRSTNCAIGNCTLTQISNWPDAPASSAHADQHMIVASPAFNNSTNKTVYFGNDGGLYRADDVATVSLTTGWVNLNNKLGITQFFGAAANAAGAIIAGAQDNGNSLFTGNANLWTPIPGMAGDGGYCAADPTDPNYLYGEYTYLQIRRSADGGASGGDIFSGITDAGNCTAPPNVFCSANFAAPFVLDPNDPNTMLAGGISLWRSNNVKAATPRWARIKPPASNGLIPPSPIQISAIAVSPNNPDFIVIGDNAGRIYLTFDGTGSNPVADGLPCSPSNSPCWSRIDTGVPARFVTRLVIDNTRSPNWIYATLGGFAVDNVYRSTDLGNTWTDVTGSGTARLPNVPIRSLVINPVRADLLYVGTEVGIFASEDAGATWHLPQDGPANVSVDELFWLKGDLVAVTHGRGIFKTITPVYGLSMCNPPPNSLCPCFGDWDCPCSWNINRVPTFDDDIAVVCSMILKPGLSNGGKARNLVVSSILTLDNSLGVVGDMANFGNIRHSPGMQSSISSRSLTNSKPPATLTLGGEINLLGGISTSGDVTNSGVIALGTSLDSNNLSTAPGSTLTLNTANVRGNLSNFGLIEAQGSINVKGDIANGGSLKGMFLTPTAPANLIKNYSGSGLWNFAGSGVPVGYTVRLGSDVTFDIASFSNNGTLDFSNRTLNFKGSSFQGDGTAAGTGTLRFVPTSGSSIFNANGPAVTIASGTIEYQSGGTISGPFTIDAGATFAMNTGGSLTANNDVTIDGTLSKIGFNPQFIFNGRTFTNNGTFGDIDFLIFNDGGGPVVQFIAGVGSWAPKNVQIGVSPSAATVRLSNNFTLATNQLVTSAGSKLDVENFTLTLTGLTNTFTGKISGTGLVKMQPTSGTPRLGTLFAPLTIDPNLEIASGTVKATATTVGGTLTIDPGATLSLFGSVGIAANGDLLNNGTLNSFSDSPFLNFKGTRFTNNGNVTGNVYANFGSSFGPPLTQNLAGTGSWIGSPRLFIDSLSTTSLLNDFTYNGGNLFVEGRLNTGTATLSLPCTVIWSGAGDVVGNVRRTNLAACPGAAIAFGNPFTTIQFTSGTPPTEITVNVVLAAPAGFLNAAKRTYLITPTGGSGYTATLRLHYLDSELNGNAESTLQLWRNNGSNWTPQGATNRNTAQNWVEYSGVTQFSPWTISGPAAPTAAPAIISGEVTTTDGTPLGGVLVALNGSGSGRAITDSFGQYRFAGVETGGFYTVTPSRPNYTFSPPNRSFSLLGVHTEASFTASANGDHANAIDTTEFFVRQQYLDFLGREPDPPGFTDWVNTISNCATGDPSCDRVHVSESFFRSQEFQQRGYFVYRFYSTALGRKPDYAEFTPDLARVSGFLTNEQLEAAKVAFVNDFMARPLFAGQYNSLSNSAYVGALINTAGVNLSNRQALIDSLNAGTQTRAQVLRQIAESGEVDQKYYNQAFVVMEYFGYLRRDPDALYLNWIDVLNQGGDSRHMVTGFVNSLEYRQRFGP